jgi:Ala-tRNA(Pro) deacylase
MSLNTGTAPHGIAAVTGWLDAEGVGYDVLEHGPTYSSMDEARATGVDPGDIAKTLALHDRTGYRFAVVPAHRRVDVSRVRELLGGTTHLRLATEAELEADFPMFDTGALPPFGPAAPLPEVVDVHLLYHDRIVCAGGDHQHSVRIDPRDLLRLAEPRVGSICVPSESGHSRFRELPRV